MYSQLFDPDPLIAARYIRLNMSTEQFARSVREILYAKVATNFVSPLMRAIRNLAVAPGKAPNLDSIITFNYDDVLEECLRGLAIDVPFHVVSDNVENLAHNISCSVGSIRRKRRSRNYSSSDATNDLTIRRRR